ncbi:hypothetical protein YYE_02704 [Plasmodium vinckei vinckei]|nr:hypothetical protein YYE_02704 [Plasmodium vinckei vinckei]
MLSSIDTTKLLSEFNTKGCKQVHKKLEQNISRNKEKSEEEEEEQGGFDTLIDLFGLDDDDDDNDGGNDDLDLDEEEDGDDLQNTTQETPPVSVPGPQQPAQSTSVHVKPVPTPSGASPSIPDNGSDTIGSKDKVVDSTQSQENTKGSEQTDTGGDTGNKANLQSDSSIHTPTSGNNQGGESRDGLDGGSNGNQVNQGGSGGINDGKGDKDINKGGTCTGSCDGGDNGTGSGKGGTNNTLPSQGNSSNQGGSDDGSKGSGDQDATKSSGTFYGYWSSNWGSRLNPLNYLPSASSIYQSSKNILTSATNQVSNAYNSAVIAVKDTYDSAVTAVKNTYDTTMTTVKGAYNATTNYIDGTVSSIIDQLNSFDTFSQLGDHQSRSGGSGNSLPTDNSPLKTPVPPSPSIPQSHSPSVTLPPSQTSPPSPSQPHSSQTQDSPQITDQNGRSDPIQIHDTNPGTGMPRTLTNFSKNPSSTGNGTKNGTVVKMNEKTSIWCIGSNKKCDLMGIGIIFISTSIILAIMYKVNNCEKFIAADRVIKGENDGNLTMDQILNDSEINKYCDNKTCKTTNEKIGGLSAYLFTKERVLETSVMETSGLYDEFFLMWLSDKLFEIGKGKSQINDITLNEAYEKYLKNNISNSNNLVPLDKIDGLKEVNLMYMKQFYKLLKYICKVIVYYRQNDDDISKIINYSTECYNQYSSLYDSVSKCISCLHLLDNLKKTYYSFIDSDISKNETKYPDLAMKLKTLKTSDGKDDYFAKGFERFDFSDEKCKPPKAKKPDSPKNPEQPPVSQEKDSPSLQKDSSLPKSQTGNSDNGKENTGGSNSNKRDLRDPASSRPGEYFYWGSPFNGFIFDRTEFFNKAFQFIDKGRQTVKEATNKITSAYNSAKTIAQDTYDKTVSIAKDTYSATTNYIGNIFSSVTNQLSSFGTFQLSDDQSGSGGSGNSLPTDNNPPRTTQIPTPDPKSPSLSSSSLQNPSQPSSNQGKDSSQPQSNQAQGPSHPTSPQKQPISTHGSQDTVHNGASNTLQQPAPSIGTGGFQTIIITKDTLPSSSTGPSNTGNGNTNGNVVKMNEKTSIWRIAQNKKYDILGIGVISISIFVFLAIMYKYLSLGWTNKSKRKKNIKKVINSIGGKRPVQIIIKSYDRNKDLKPIINSVGRKKDPLLNIYKLMQADPIPFINLFFLLIFFVYKRKENFLEL